MFLAQWMGKGAAMFAVLLAMAVGVALTPNSVLFALSPLGLFAMLGGAVFAYAVAKNYQWALALLFVAAALIFAANLRGDAEAGRLNDFDAVNLLKLGLFGLALLAGLGSLDAVRRRVLEPQTLLLGLYLSWAVVTVVASRQPFFSLAAAISMSALVAFAIALNDRLHLRDILLLLILAGAVFCLGSIAAFYLFPDYARFISFGVTRLTGLATTPNEAGQFAAFTLIAIVAFYVSGFHREGVPGGVRWAIYVAAIAAPVVLFMAQGRSAIVAVFVGCATIILQRYRLARPALMAGILVVAFGAIALAASPRTMKWIETQASDISRSGNTNEVWSAAGRAALWAFVADQIGNRPITGYGYGAGAKVIAENYTTRWGEVTGSAHNAFLQTSLDLGLVGGALLVALFAWSLREFFRNPSPFRDGIFVLVLITSLLESAISKPAGTMTLLWLVSLFVIDRSRGGEEDNEPQISPMHQ